VLLRREEGRSFSQKIVVQPQVPDLFTQPNQLGPFTSIQLRARLRTQPSTLLPDPTTQQLGTDPNVLRDMRNRTIRVDHQMSSLNTVLGSK
jgi:hypothetical protein